MFSKPSARKVRNLRANASVMLALGDAEDDFDVGLIEARAELIDRPTREVLPPGHLAKYADQLAAIGLSAADYSDHLFAGHPDRAARLPAVARPDDAVERPARRGARRLASPNRVAPGPTMASRSPDVHHCRDGRSSSPPVHGRSLRGWLGEPLAGVLPRLTPRRIGSDAPAL